MTALATINGYGLAADRPAAGTPGAQYYASDTDVLSRDNGTTWDDLAPGGGGVLPTGGATGQVLTKQSGTDGDADWETPSGGGSANLVDAQTAGVGGAASFSFSSLPASGEILTIVVVGASEAATAGAALSMRFNGDSGANYHDQFFVSFDGTGTAGGEDAGATAINCGALPGTSSPSGASAMIRIVIPNYRGTVFHKTVETREGRYYGSAQAALVEGMGIWKSTAAITSIVLTLAGGDFAEGTKAYLLCDDL